MGDIDVDYRIILKLTLKKLDVGMMDWIQWAYDRVQWSALVNVVMNFRFHKRGGIS